MSIHKIEKYKYKLVHEPINSPKFATYLERLNYHYSLIGSGKNDKSKKKPDSKPAAKRDCSSYESKAKAIAAGCIEKKCNDNMCYADAPFCKYDNTGKWCVNNFEMSFNPLSYPK